MLRLTVALTKLTCVAGTYRMVSQACKGRQSASTSEYQSFQLLVLQVLASTQ